MSLPRVVNGMHLPNRKMWDVEKAIACARGTGCVTILHHLMFSRDELAGQWGDGENRFWYGKLRNGWPAQNIPPAPELLIHVRMYHPQWKHVDPVVWAQHSVNMLSTWQFEGERANLWNDPFVCVSPANEQDIEDRPAGTGASTVAEYEEIGKWNAAWAREVNRLLPNRKALLCWPAFAGGHDAIHDDPDSEYAVDAVRAAMALYDLGAVHLYGHAEWGAADGAKTMPGGADQYWHMLRAFRPKGWRDVNQPSVARPRDRGGFCAQYPGKPFIISESGTFGHSNPALTSQTLNAWVGLLDTAAHNGNCLGVTPFIWNSDESHPTNVIWSNVELRNAAPNIGAAPTTARVPVRGATRPVPQPTPVPVPAPTPVTLRPRVSPAVLVYAIHAGGEGAAAFAARAAGYGSETPGGMTAATWYKQRLVWARELAAANPGVVNDANGNPVFNPNSAYRLPQSWFKVSEA